MAELAAVVGVGQTKYQTKRSDVSIAGLVREAAVNALKDAELTWDDIDAVIVGKAPDMFEGIIMPEAYLTDALGCNGKPMLRVHTAGSVGGSTAIVAASYVQSGMFKRILTVAFEKQSESNAMWALSNPQPFSPHLNAGAGGYFAPIIREYMRRSNAPYNTGIRVATKDRLHGALNPLAHLKLGEITEEQVEHSGMLWDPIRMLESCPSSDGACAMVIANEELAEQSPKKPAWIRGTAMRSEPTMFAEREEVNPLAGRQCAADVYQQAGITNPRKEIDCAEIYVPFSWYEPMWLENLGFAEEGEGWKLTMDNVTSLIDGGDTPWNPSGGVLSSNPIGASGMIRFAEAAQQVRGECGDHQVPGAKTAMGHAYGGGAQFYAMWIVSADKG
ncbi:thiolase domain-containing protein [Endozoicomonas numazuensis]|uniref:Acetyl-CoA acetyltransferase n=1 Tax=Endozoicomonas numazuensis TaxID=1137799 RepID=A0A081NMP4_9GAMM|nr:thiolase domain-containing protein [Endozoicomonas numazuensis]KEQ19717.1 acetyl-CoA acetyltransferase [Endozoicomonas numazuensis]